MANKLFNENCLVTNNAKISELQVGKAGEYLVCADLILKGYVAYLSEQGLHYDIVADVCGRLIRIQVKTTKEYKQSPVIIRKTPSYLFQCRRCGKKGRMSYSDSDIDIMAFVAIYDNLIGYLPIREVKQTMHFRTKKFEYYGSKAGRYLEDFSFERALNENF